jgi:hypothetical protein
MELNVYLDALFALPPGEGALDIRWTGPQSRFGHGGKKNKKIWEEIIKGRPTLRLAVYRQSGRLGAKPLVAHDQFFFCN